MDHDTKWFVRTGGEFYGIVHEESKEEMRLLYAQIRNIEHILK